MKEFKVFETILVLRLDLLSLDHLRQPHLVHLALHLIDLVLESHLSHGLELFAVIHRHLIFLLQLLPLDLPGKQLLGLVKEKTLNLQLDLLHLGVLVTHRLMILVLPVPKVFLELPAILLKLQDFLLVGLTLRGLQFGGQHLGR
jgi:hypothetical protein